MKNKTYAILFILILIPAISISQDLILDGNSIPLNANSTVTIDLNGNITMTSQAGDLTCSSNTTAPVLSQLSANPTSVLTGGDSTISWTVSGQATSCAKSGAWSGTFSGADVTDGTHSDLVTNITSNSTFSLQCSNSTGNSGTLSTNVSVTGSANCVTQPPILNGAEDTTIIANNTSPAIGYDGTYQGFQNNGGATPDWPGNSGESISLSLTTGRYISASFTTNNLSQTGRIQFAPAGNAQGGPSANSTISISECPGDFATHLGKPSCLDTAAVSGSFKWSTDPNEDPNQFCILEKNTPYYFNFVHSLDDPTYSVSTCTIPNCGILANQIFD